MRGKAFIESPLTATHDLRGQAEEAKDLPSTLDGALGESRECRYALNAWSAVSAGAKVSMHSVRGSDLRQYAEGYAILRSAKNGKNVGVAVRVGDRDRPR